MTSTQAAPEPLQVRVKELEWRERDGRILGFAPYMMEYEISFKDAYVRVLGLGLNKFPSVDAAKAACQADYERRVLAALDLSTQTQIAALEVTSAEKVADLIGVTPYSDMRPFVVEAVRYARELDALAEPARAALEAENVKLRAERDEARERNDRMTREAGAHFAKSCALADQALTAEAEVARLTDALKAVRGEAARARGDQAYRDLARFVLKATLAALKGSTDAQA